MKRAVIAGGGIIGASIAWNLTRRGAHVTVVEKYKPGAGATQDSFAWINATYSKRPRHYFELNRMGVAAWRRLERNMVEPPLIQWGGSVEWCERSTQADELRRAVERHRSWGYATRFIDQQDMRDLLPQITPGLIGTAAFSEAEGVVDPVAATVAILREAPVVLHYPCAVTGLRLVGRRVTSVITTLGALAADVFVVACGTGTPHVAAMAGVQVPLKESPGLLVHTVSQAPLLERVALGPGSHMKQDASGRVVVGDNFAGGEVPHHQVLEHAAGFLPRLNTTVERVSQGLRVMPEDEYPIVGFAESCPNLYVVATHSGVTLAALLGEFAAAEIVDQTPIEMLEPYRLSRFAQGNGFARGL